MPNATDTRTTNAQSTQTELVITRVLDAPRDIVWKAWADRDQSVQWWGPKGFTTRVLEWDQRPGGAWRAIMYSPEGTEHPQHGVYKEIAPPQRMIYTFIWEDEDTPDRVATVTVTFTPRGDQTEMTFRKGPFRSEEWRRGEEDGWNESFDRLEEYVRGQL
jgi:uncharacterized protein YndB with AHSA1/START domain